MSTQQSSSVSNAMLSGAMGGVFMVISSHPFDLIKTRLQTNNFPIHIKSFIQAANYAINESTNSKNSFKINQLYKGVIPVLLGSAPLCALSFAGYQMGQNMIKTFIQNKELSTLHYGLAGSIAGASTVLLITPLERFKILLQTSNQSFTGLWKQHGTKHFMRGFKVTLLRDMLGNFIYFSIFLSSKSKLNVLASGGFAGMACWIVIFPIDCVKSKFQKNTNTTLTHILKECRLNGLRSLYKGLSSTLLRAFPASAAFFLGVEMGKEIFV